MKETYELHIGNIVKPSDNFAELQALAKASSDPYVIYLVKQSAMNKGFNGYGVHRKVLTDTAIEKVLSLINRGRKQKDIAQQMHLSTSTLGKILREYKLKNPDELPTVKMIAQ